MGKDDGFKRWDPIGADAAEIFRLLHLGVIEHNQEGQRTLAWDEYVKLKDSWINTLYKRRRLNENFNKTFDRYQEWKRDQTSTFFHPLVSIQLIPCSNVSPALTVVQLKSHPLLN
jgi:hypothetical protein